MVIIDSDLWGDGHFEQVVISAGLTVTSFDDKMYENIWHVLTVQ